MKPRGALVVLSLALTMSVARAESKGDASGFRAYRSAGWNIVESENFRFRSRGSLNINGQVVRATESLRIELGQRWLAEELKPWQPKCDIVLHATSDAYQRAVPGGGQTVGSSEIQTVGDRIAGRRIDIRADQTGWFRAALGHELTHVVLADVFPDGRLPAWADEGMAVLADSGTKQDAHWRDLLSAHSQHRAFRLVELLALEGYPAADRQPAFYGQSASLVRYLVARGTPEQFVRFVRSAGSDGYDSAVRQVYGLKGVHDLERRWLQQVNTAGAVARN